MKAILNMLSGHKTNLGMVALGILGICWGQGWITEDMAKVIAPLLAAWTGVSLRQGVKKSAA